MIDRQELELIRKTRNISLYFLEKEYLLAVFLYAIYEQTDKLIFKGGTCLRFAYGYPRLSVDLDFNTDMAVREIKAVVKNALKKFESLGIEHSIVKEEMFDKGYTARFRFKGPLYTGREDSTNSVSLDIGVRKTYHSSIVQINKIFPDVPMFFANCMDLDEILAEKLTTLFTRNKGRDLFDIWALISNKITVDTKVMAKKFKEMKVKFTPDVSFCTEKEYENDLSALTISKPSYAQASRNVRAFLRSLKVSRKNRNVTA